MQLSDELNDSYTQLGYINTLIVLRLGVLNILSPPPSTREEKQNNCGYSTA